VGFRQGEKGFNWVQFNSFKAETQMLNTGDRQLPKPDCETVEKGPEGMDESKKRRKY